MSVESPLRSSEIDASLRVSDLKWLADGWVLDGEYRQLNATTLESRRLLVDKLLC